MRNQLEKIVQLHEITLKDINSGKVFMEIESPLDDCVGFEEVEFLSSEDEIYIPGDYLVSGKVKLNDGTIMPALLYMDVSSSGECMSAYVLINEGFIDLYEKTSPEKIGKQNDQVHPIKYNLCRRIEGDIHTSDHF